MIPDFKIDPNAIEDSFIRIAKDLFNNYQLILNNKAFLLTEIEFYYHHINKHKDMSVHEHEVKIGNWRAHKQGLDISLGSGLEYDGGILIRGICESDTFINGPQRVLWKIFEEIGSSELQSVNIGLSPLEKRLARDIFQTTRVGLGESAKDFELKPYNFFCEIKKWKGCYTTKQIEHYSNAIKIK